MPESTIGDDVWNQMTEAEKTEVVGQGCATLSQLTLKTRRSRSKTKSSRQRFGLPEGFISRLQRNGRTVLLEDNVYILPNGDEFIPCHPTGTLGRIRHLYALLTPAQHNQRARGSVYIRTDGRIFDYSVDLANPEQEMFDTGYTIDDLERTGRYGTPIASTKTSRISKRKATTKASVAKA
jgi:hypothetical protein